MQALKIPDLLNKLILNGEWPDDYWSQETSPIVSKDDIPKAFPDFDMIVLQPPPFHSIAEDINSGNKFWVNDLTNYGEIDYCKAVIIADFGSGSDSPIILYYDNIELSPKIMFLRWSFSNNGENVHHSWVCSHASFEDFVNDIDLLNLLKNENTEP